MGLPGYNYANIVANGPTTLTPGAGSTSFKGGILHTVVVNNPGTTWVLTLFDNNGASGAKIATIAVVAGMSLLYDVEFSLGLTVSGGGTAGDATICWWGAA